MKKEHYPKLGLCIRLMDAWFPDTEKSLYDYPNQEELYDVDDLEEFEEYRVPCPSVSELLDELPWVLYLKDKNWNEVPYYLTMWKYTVWYENSKEEPRISQKIWQNLAEALWEMWLEVRDIIELYEMNNFYN